jgi:hypothetical protein
MRFINGGEPTPREEVRSRILPVVFDFYERFDGFGYWAAEERSTGRFLGWFHFRPRRTDRTARSSSGTGCAGRPGGGATRPKGRGP